MTDDVDLLLNIAPRLVGRTVPGAPPSVDGRRRFHAPPHLRVRLCVACLPQLAGYGRLAWPLATAFPTARPPPPTAQRVQSRGHSPRTIVRRDNVTHQPAHHFIRASDVDRRPTPGGRGSQPLRWASASHPRCRNPSVTAHRAATAPLSGEPMGGRRFVEFSRLFTTMLIPTFSDRP